MTYHGGKFYLYYSVGNETLMEIRLAVSDSPERGFIDSGVRLTREGLLYVCDRTNDRYQVFRKDGTFVLCEQNAHIHREVLDLIDAGS